MAPLAAVMREGHNGLPRVELIHASGATAEVYLHGALLSSWRPAGEEVIFLSEQAVLGTDTEVHGGVPIVFPQFGPGPLPQHGFARQHPWTLVESGSGARQTAFARLRLQDTTETRTLWPHSFVVELTVSLATVLEMSLEVTNAGNDPFGFAAGLHNYFRVDDVGEVRIEGLRGIRFRDKTAGEAERVDREEAVRIREEIDRIYLSAPDSVMLRDPAGARTLTLRKRGFADVVVWNPWRERARELENFGAEEYQSMVCVEAAQVGEPVHLEPGESWRAMQILSVAPGDPGRTGGSERE